LHELTRTHTNLVDDSTRARQRLKALFRARAVPAAGERVYAPGNRADWLAKLPDRGARFRAEMLFAEIDLLRELRPRAKAAMVAEARRDPALPVLRRRKPLTRGLNRNHNRILKDVFKSTAAASLGRPGPFQDLYRGMLERGMREEMARLTLARKFAALTLRLWKTGERYDPTKLTRQVT
jgi:hypothetical protein